MPNERGPPDNEKSKKKGPIGNETWQVPRSVLKNRLKTAAKQVPHLFIALSLIFGLGPIEALISPELVLVNEAFSQCLDVVEILQTLRHALRTLRKLRRNSTNNDE